MWLHATYDEFLELEHLFVLWRYKINLVYHMYFWLQDKKYYPTAEEVFGPEVEVRACRIILLSYQVAEFCVDMEKCIYMYCVIYAYIYLFVYLLQLTALWVNKE